jgi:hypothetical protein
MKFENYSGINVRRLIIYMSVWEGFYNYFVSILYIGHGCAVCRQRYIVHITSPGTFCEVVNRAPTQGKVSIMVRSF